jgi:polysaccharide biosynthesis transport protein
MRTEQNTPPWLLANATRFNESDEGGLDLGQIVATIRRKALLIAGITIGVASLAALKAITDTPVYQGQFEILTEPITVETKIISATNPDTLNKEEDLSETQTDEVKLKILKSPEVMAPIVKQIQTRFPDITYKSIFESLNITPVGDKSEVLTITYQNPDAEQVQYVLDVVSRAYLAYSLDSRKIGINRGIEFVEAQLPKLQSRVTIQQERLQKIRQRYNIVDPETKGKQLSELLGAFGEQQLEAQIQLNEAKALYTTLQKELTRQDTGTAVGPTLTQNTRYQNLLSQLLEIDSQMAKDSVLLGEESPEIQTIQRQRQNLLPLIRQEGQRVVRETAIRIQELETRNLILNQTLERVNREVKQLSLVLRQYNDIQRELEIATENLNQFLSRREALRIEAAQREIPWRLLTPPEEPQPQSASLKKNLLLGGILGLLLGLGAALATDKLSNLLYTSQELKEIAKLPILGVIPYERFLPAADNKLVPVSLVDRALTQVNGYKKPQNQTSPAFLEAFRFLYTNIRLLNPDAPIQSFVVSSAADEEGKSIVAIYLAQTAAAIGQRVLLVDTDLRYPSLHERLLLPNQEGLTDLLSQDTIELNNAIQRSPLEDNLFILTAGSLSADPTRLLASVKMQELMKTLQAAFDLVIYKAPSLSEFADSYLLANYTNGILFVAGLGKLKRPLLEQALDELKISATPILGIVANRAKNSASFSMSKMS